ncbi:MAG: hypothetical protein QM613_05895 [Micrococcaceae bacterium]
MSVLDGIQERFRRFKTRKLEDLITVDEAREKHEVSETILQYHAPEVRRREINGVMHYSEGDIIARDERITREVEADAERFSGMFLSDEEYEKKYSAYENGKEL